MTYGFFRKMYEKRRKMKKIVFFLVAFLFSITSHAFWGGDLIYLSKILQQSIYQLEQLRKITGTNEEILRFLRDTN